MIKGVVAILCATVILLLTFEMKATITPVMEARAAQNIENPVRIAAFALETSHLVICPRGLSMPSACPHPQPKRLRVKAEATSLTSERLRYQYSVSAGKIIGHGRDVLWDIAGLGPGDYSIKVTVTDQHRHSAESSASLALKPCDTCDPPIYFPKIVLSCPDTSIEGEVVLVSVALSGKPVERTFPKYEFNWSLSAGRIVQGAGTKRIKIDTSGLGRQSISATVEVKGLDPAAPRTASCGIAIQPK